VHDSDDYPHTIWRATADLLNTYHRDRGFFLPAESVALRKYIAVSLDFHGLRRRFGRSICATAPLPFPAIPNRASHPLSKMVSWQEGMRPGALAVEGAIFEHRNADMLDPWPK